MMKRLLSFAFLLLVGCAEDRAIVFAPGSGGNRIIYRKSPSDPVPVYQLEASGKDTGSVRSIFDTVEYDPIYGFELTHQIHWSPSGRTAVLYESVNADSPVYRHLLIRFSADDSASAEVHQIDLGRRHAGDFDVYGHWPDVIGVDDNLVELEWVSDPQQEMVRIGGLVANATPVAVIPPEVD